MLYPCKHEFDPAWNGDGGPQCDGAAHVKVVCRRASAHREYVCALRKPEPVSALSEAALRAFDSLELELDRAN